MLLVVTRRSIGSPKRLAAVALAALYLCSVLGRYDIGLSIAPWLALERWYQFFLGTLTFWLVSGRISWRPLAGAWTVLPLVVATGEARPVDMIPVVMSALLWAAHARDGMQTWLASRTWQFLGTISYSLYLFHLIFGWRWIRVVGRVVGPDAPGAVAFGAFLSGVAVSVLSAWAMWRLVEVPSLALSRSVSMAGRAAPKLDPATDREDALMPERPRP